MTLQHAVCFNIHSVLQLCVCVSDCPQVQCVEQYIAQQADELTLEPTEIINVIRKTNEGKNAEGIPRSCSFIYQAATETSWPLDAKSEKIITHRRH